MLGQMSTKYIANHGALVAVHTKCWFITDSVAVDFTTSSCDDELKMATKSSKIWQQKKPTTNLGIANCLFEVQY